MGFLNRKVRRTEDLHANGVRGTARIDALKMLNRGEFQYSGPTDGWADGSSSVIRVKLDLTVSVPGAEPYSLRTKLQVPMMSFTKLGVGGTVPVVVDPDDHDRLEIDWDGEIVEPTLEQRAELDPMLRSMLDRRDEPPG